MNSSKNIFSKNAVLFKDMTIDIKRPKIMILMLIFNVILFTIVAGFLIVITTEGMRGNAIDYRTLATMLIVLICVEAGILFLVIPALTGHSVSGERERQTLDVLLTTRLTPLEIVLGKFLSATIMAALLVLSTFPLLALVFIYGGMNFLQLFGLVFVVIFEVAYVASFGIFFSSSIKRTAPSIVLSYVVLGFLHFGTLFISFLIYALVEASGSFQYYAHMQQTTNSVHVDWIFFLLYINPGVTIFDCIGIFIGVDPGDVAFKGMQSAVDLNYITGDSFVVKFWTPISMVIQGAIAYGLLRLSAYNLSPVKNHKKREQSFQMNNMKKIGVQPDVPIQPEGAPAQPQMNAPVPPTPSVQQQMTDAMERASVPPTGAVQQQPAMQQAPVPPTPSVQQQPAMQQAPYQNQPPYQGPMQ